MKTATHCKFGVVKTLLRCVALATQVVILELYLDQMTQDSRKLVGRNILVSMSVGVEMERTKLIKKNSLTYAYGSAGIDKPYAS